MDITSISVDEVYQTLHTSPDGLSTSEAATRLRGFGTNEIRRLKKTPLWVRFLSQFTHFFALLLWVAAGLAFLAQFINPEEGTAVLGFSIIGVIFINAVFTFLQEYKAERAAEALQRLLPFAVTVLRDGEEMDIPAKEVVPGDLVILREGDRIPADARVVEQYELRVNNAALTGESEPVARTAESIEEVEHIESPNLVFSGTSVVSGVGNAVAYATGMSTEFGRIASLTQGIEVEPSPLQLEVARVTRIVATIAVGLGIVFFISGQLVGRTFIQNFLFAIGIIVANVPEGLLPTVTLSLAIASQRMAGRNALIKNLSSVETLGATTVICTDKTGTLTQNQMTVRRIYVDGRTVSVTGTGYEPRGEFLDAAGMPLPVHNTLKLALKIGALANDARLTQSEGRWDIMGDPTEGALIVAAAKAFDLEDLRENSPRVFEVPFSSERKRMTTVNEMGEQRVAHVKGALESVLPLCTRIIENREIRSLTDEDRKRIERQNEEYAHAALRVLSLAYRDVGEEELEASGVERDLVFVGLAGMIDPPRPEVADAIRRSRDAGIRVIMITGDHQKTAEAIAEQIGLVTGVALVVTGTELNRMTPDQLQDALDHEEVVFARMSPRHKLMVVEALKTRDEVVAVTGDGVNDAPALKRADIGIAMGITGTDVAKEAADMILVDDNFASIVNAVEEGRAVFTNIRRFITYIFASNIPEIVPYLGFILFGIPLPLTVIQILAVDLGTDMLPALALGAERPEPGIMKRPPRPRAERLLRLPVLLRAYFWLGPFEALAALAGFFWLLFAAGWTFGVELSPHDPVYLAATTMTFAGIVFTQIANGQVVRTDTEPVATIGLFSNRLLIYGIISEILLLAFIVYNPFANAIFGTHPLPIEAWYFLAPFPILLFAAEEGRKMLKKSLQEREEEKAYKT